MALTYVTLTVDLADGQGNIPSGGTASFVPSAVPRVTTIPFLVTGLTAGNSYNFDLLFAIAGAATLTVTAFGSTSTTPTGTQGAPVTMTVQAV